MAFRLAAAARVEQIVAAIRRMIDPDVAIAGWRPLAGGTGVRSFAVEVAGRRIVAKLADVSGLGALPIEEEFRLLEHAASIGIAPEPIGIDREAGLLLCEYVDAAPWAAGEFDSTENVVRLADRVRMLHTLPSDVRPYDPLEFADLYVHACADTDRASAIELRAELAERSGFLEDAARGIVVCHNDLHLSNILRATELLFIDFEYAVAAPPIVDLASIISMNAFDAAQTERLIGAYYTGGDAPFEAQDLVDAVRVHEVLADLWHMARAGRSAAPADKNISDRFRS
jgi:aminoglycoside phosphotransferase (APT) family kinase protein